MATVTLKNNRAREFGSSPYGNTTTLDFKVITNASGGATEADSASALAIADVLDLGQLPGGMRLDDAQILVKTAFTASVTASLGFKYADGVDLSGDDAQDAAYFGSGLALSSAARVRAAGAGKSITLKKPARLIATFAGANNAKAAEAKVLVSGVLVGNL